MSQCSSEVHPHTSSTQTHQVLLTSVDPVTETKGRKKFLISLQSFSSTFTTQHRRAFDGVKQRNKKKLKAKSNFRGVCASVARKVSFDEAWANGKNKFSSYFLWVKARNGKKNSREEEKWKSIYHTKDTKTTAEKIATQTEIIFEGRNSKTQRDSHSK